jgi:hypothetical protein
MLAGALAPRCVFQIGVETYPDANELVLQTDLPWLSSGIGGVRRVRKSAEELVRAIACVIEQEGGTILERKEF